MTRLAIDGPGGAELSAFLDLIAYSEIKPALLAKSDDGYDVLYGSTPSEPHLFAPYARHPAVFVPIKNDPKNRKSTAAGRYQILFYIAESLCTRLRVNDFTPVTQDRMAISLIGEKHGAIDAIHVGDIEKAVVLCRSTWASFPGANYPGQPMNKMDELLKAYALALPNYTKPKPADFSNVESGVASTAPMVAGDLSHPDSVRQGN